MQSLWRVQSTTACRGVRALATPARSAQSAVAASVGRARVPVVPPAPPSGSPPFRRWKLSTYFWILGAGTSSYLTYRYFSRKSSSKLPQVTLEGAELGEAVPAAAPPQQASNEPTTSTPAKADVAAASATSPSPPPDTTLRALKPEAYEIVYPTNPVMGTAAVLQPQEGLVKFVAGRTTSSSQPPFCAVVTFQPTMAVDRFTLYKRLAALPDAVTASNAATSVAVGFSTSVWRHVYKFAVHNDSMIAPGWENLVFPGNAPTRAEAVPVPAPEVRVPKSVETNEEVIVLVESSSQAGLEAGVAAVHDAFGLNGWLGFLRGTPGLGYVLPSNNSSSAAVGPFLSEAGAAFAALSSVPFPAKAGTLVVPVANPKHSATTPAASLLVASTSGVVLDAITSHSDDVVFWFYFPSRGQLQQLQYATQAQVVSQPDVPRKGVADAPPPQDSKTQE